MAAAASTGGACRYCGAALVARGPESGRTEERFTLVLRVGPSNSSRIARLLSGELGIAEGEVRSLLARTPSEVATGNDERRAYALAHLCSDGGAHAEVVKHTVTIPLVDVELVDAGAKKLAVIAALREHVELGVREAKRLVESAPAVLATALDDRKAHALVKALEAAGASVRTR